MIKEAFPLAWPEGWPREENPQRSRFGTWNKKPSIHMATEKIIHEMKLFGGTDLIISSNLKLRLDGLPYSNQRSPEDKGIAVYFTFKGEQKVIACDTFDLIGCNLWAVAKTIEAMRGIDRWGCSQIIDKAFTGFTALPEKIEEEWWQVLGVEKDDDEGIVKMQYRKLVKEHHPDRGGDVNRFRIVGKAFQEFQDLNKK